MGMKGGKWKGMGPAGGAHANWESPTGFGRKFDVEGIRNQ